MMKVVVTPAVAAGVLAFANVGAQDAQTDPIGEEQLRSSLEIRRGAEDSASIPRAAAVAQLPNSISELDLEQGDIAVLERWAQELVEIEQRGKERIESHYEEFCNQLQSGVVDVVSELNEVSRLVAENREAVLSSFGEAASLLSNRGRLVVNTYIDNVLLPGTSIVHLDYVKLLREAGQEAVAAHARAQCVFRAEHSEQEILDVLNRARDASGGVNSSQERGGQTDSDNNPQRQGVSGELESVL